MKINEVTESFDSFKDRNIKCLRATNDIFITTEQIGNREIRFTAALVEAGLWNIDFVERSTANVTYGKSGSGNQMQVFGFVVESLKLFMEKYNPMQVDFTSDKSDGNRTRLYNSIAKKISIPGYKIETKSGTGYDLFSIVRDK